MESNQRNTDMKNMKLYSHVDRVYNELRELGYSRDSLLKVSDVNEVDQYHYHGTQAIDPVINNLPIISSCRVLDIGSGLGGPARYLASQTQCHVTAIEIQPDLHDTAQDLTTRCRLQDKVTHLCGNFMEMDLEQLVDHDAVVSWLVFLHIADKSRLLQKCHKCLKPGGKLYVEDFFQLSPFTAEEIILLERDVCSKDVPTKNEYVKHLEQAGFTSIQFEDVTQDWRDFVHQRLMSYQNSKDRHIRVHNEAIFKEQEHFYQSMDTLYSGGHLGGCKITATSSCSN